MSGVGPEICDTPSGPKNKSERGHNSSAFFFFGMATPSLFNLSTKQRGVKRTCVFIEEMMEARVGIEPTNEGFADLSLPTWVPRLGGTV
jgi:hypothetical protein